MVLDSVSNNRPLIWKMLRTITVRFHFFCTITKRFFEGYFKEQRWTVLNFEVNNFNIFL